MEDSELETAELSDTIIKVLAKSILATLLKDKSCMQRFGFILEEKNFENPIHRMMFRIGREYFEKYGRVPQSKSFEVELKQRLERGEGRHIPDEYFWKDATEILNREVDRDYVEDKIGEWLMRKSLMDISKKAKVVALSSDPSMEEIEKSVREVELRKMGGEDLGEYVFKDLPKRDRRKYEGDFIPTGIKELDIVLGGGREKGTLGVIMAPTGQGKSAVLITFGVNASRQRYKVAHVTLELSQHAVLRRYEAAYSRIAKPKIISQEKKVNRRLKRIGRLVRPADVIVKEFPARGLGIGGLRAWLANLEFWDEFVPDLLVLDYADIMKLPGGSDDKWIQQGDLYTELRGFGQEKHIAIWTGVQSKKGSLTKKKIKIDDIAGAVEKAHIADAIVAVCHTDEEKEAHMGRFFVAKNRDNIDEVTIKFKEQLDKCIIESISKAEVHREREPGEDEDELPPPSSGEDTGEEEPPF